MAKNTRQVTQYEIYTLYETVEKTRGKDDAGNPITYEVRVPVAIFDDIELLTAFSAARAANVGDSYDNDYASDWREIEPAADQFSLPFNPAPEEPVEEADTSA